MSRPILSRPRTRVYGCNYDKGESYYKPMVDHLDRKYSGRPLFSEPRNSLADEIAARRSDIGSRSLSGNNRDDPYDELDFIYERGPQDDLEDDYVTAQRRYKARAAAAFEEDLAELRRKRRDMQDRLFDVIDLNAEIEKARNTLEAADLAFQRHATKFDNEDREDMTVTEKLDRSRKIASMDVVPDKPQQQRPMALKWAQIPPVDLDSCLPHPNKPRQNRICSLVEAAEITDPLDSVALQPLKRRFSKRKKSVSF